MPRVCFQLQVKPDRIAEYRARHAEVWQDMLEALEATGWRNYSLFISETGMVIGYVECEDFDASRRAMEETDVNARWQAEMGEFFVGLEGRRPDEGLLLLDEIFHLD
jgi:L-rhamnose mutarotase